MTISKHAQDEHRVRSNVRSYYAKLAESGASPSSCCGGEAESHARVDSTCLLYDAPEIAGLPPEVRALSAGCGDPVTLASLLPGQTVLDLGSGGGIDCFFAAQEVGHQGHVIGVDMTPAMLEKARANQARLELANVEFRLGEIEHLPVPDASVDVIISNCVINLSPDKPQVFQEAFRVLKPGGRLALSDIVSDGPMPAELKNNPDAWCACVSGAIDAQTYAEELSQAGFVDIVVERVEYDRGTLDELLKPSQTNTAVEDQLSGGAQKAYAVVDGDVREVGSIQGSLPYSARITARKPA
ncbi:MAG: arsenite methyltransferase [Anaerolineales bacterium]|jgi:arsenite methyltransferase